MRETEDRIFAERLQAEESEIAREEEAAARARRQAERDRQALVEALRRDFPNARQCGGCGFGPIDHMACNNLRTHHGEQRGPGRINNACPRCGWFRDSIGEWPRWDGRVHDDNTN